jgi:hypothetical protein
VLVGVSNPSKKTVTVGLCLFLMSDPECYQRLEQTTPPLTAEDGAHTVVLHVVDSARIVRFEFETSEQWGPEGWNVEQIAVGPHPQMMGVVPVVFISAAPGDALRFETPRAGTDIRVQVKRTNLGPPEQLTVRAVLLPVQAVRRARKEAKQ